MDPQIQALNERIAAASAFLQDIKAQMSRVIVGQEYLLDRLLVALLEAMQERQVTIGGQTFPLPQPFLVLATQNPIEQEGTYPLPEAQIDRFMMKVLIAVSYTHLRAHETVLDLVCRLL